MHMFLAASYCKHADSQQIINKPGAKHQNIIRYAQIGKSNDTSLFEKDTLMIDNEYGFIHNCA